MSINTLEEFTARVAQLPEQERFAITTVSANAFNGSMWAVVDGSTVSGNMELIRNVNYFSTYKLGEKYLINANPVLFLDGLKKVDMDMFEQTNEAYNTNKSKAVEAFTKRLKTWVSQASKGERKHALGIFSVNASPSATAPDGTRIPAFQLTFGQLGALLNKASQQYGVQFRVELTPNAVVNEVGKIPTGFNLTGVTMCRDDNAMMVHLLIG